MKQTLATILFMLLCIGLPVSAQKIGLEIASFEYVQTDAGAQKGGKYAKTDRNNKYYAIIKVSSNNDKNEDLTKFTYNFYSQTAYGDDVAPKWRENELWIYVRGGAREVTISRDDNYLGPTKYNLTQHLGGQPLKEGCVYRMKLKFDNVNAPVVGEQMVVFEYDRDYPGVEVRIHEKGSAADFELFRDSDPSGIRGKMMKYGTYEYKITAIGYETSGEFTLDGKEPRHEEKVSMALNYALLRIENPQNLTGARVFVDNKEIGTLPYTGDLHWETGKEYSVEIRMDRYETYREKVKLQRGENTISPILKPDFATITLIVEDGANAQIWVDGEDKKSTGRWSGELMSGGHMYETRMASHKVNSGSFEVKAGVDDSIVVSAPIPIYGKLEVYSNPPRATIMLDGKNVGTTPLPLDKVLIGEHRLELILDGYKTFTKDITLLENPPYEINETLEAGKKAKPTPKPVPTPKPTPSPSPVKKEKPWNIYLEPTFQVGSCMAVGGGIGAYIYNVNIEASFQKGLKKDEIWWVNDNIWSYSGLSSVLENFSSTKIEGKIGYGISMGKRFRLTAQIGMSSIQLSGDKDTKCYALGMSLGARAEFRIVNHLGISLAPNYGFAMKKSDIYSTISDASSTISNYAKGFNARVGIFVSF